MTVFFLTTGNDTFPGVGQNNSGNDIIYGGAGNDSIRAGFGNDIINGDTGADSLFGEDGNDSLYGGFLPGGEMLDGGAGTDLAAFGFRDVTGAGGQPVRVTVTFSATSFQVLVDGMVNSVVQNCEQLQIDSGNAGDRITGGALADIIQSLGGNDRLYAGGGDDFVSKTWGTYDLDGGIGNDRLSVTNTDNGGNTFGLRFDARTGTIIGSTITTGTFRGFEAYTVTGTDRDDEIYAADGADVLNGLDGRDTISAFGGNDILDGGRGEDQIYGGDGNDTIYGGTLAAPRDQTQDGLYGDNGDDLIVVPSLAGPGWRLFWDAGFYGGDGNDVLQVQMQNGVFDFTSAEIISIETLASSGSALGTINLTAAQLNAFTDVTARAKFYMWTSEAVVLDGIFNGILQLTDLGQSVDLSAATTTLTTVATVVEGGAYNDTIVGFAQGGLILGNDGDDSLRSTYTGTGQDTLQAGAGNDTLTGSDAGNTLDGRGGSDSLTGLDGNDLLYGGADADTLLGGKGDDTLSGDGGRDRMTGHAGADLFSFTFLTQSTPDAKRADVITDFTVDPAVGAGFIDRIDVSAIDALAITDNDTFTFIGTAGFTAEGQLRVWQDGADTIVEMNTSGASVAEMTIRLAGVVATTIDAADFVL